MTAGLAFWILMLLWAVSVAAYHYQQAPPPGYPWYIGGSILTFVLLCLLGWSVYGPPIRF